MTFAKKSFLSRFVGVLKDKEDLKSPIVIKQGDSVDSELIRLQKQLAGEQLDVNRKKIEEQIKFLNIGKAGEQSLLFELTNSFLPMLILHDVYIEHKGLNAQFDFILVTRQFLLVIEVKKYYGNIIVNDKGQFIRTVNRGKHVVFKEGMYSPIRQVERQVAVLQSMLVDHDVITKTPIRYAVAFANEKTVIDLSKAPKEIEEKVFRTDGIVSFIKAELAKKSPVYFKDGKMHELAVYIHEQHIDKHSIEAVEDQEIAFYEEEEVPVAATLEKKSFLLSDEELALALKKFRKRLADETERKAFYIFTNKTLDELVEMRPSTLDALRNIEGIGEKKLEEFGLELVKIIKESLDNGR